MGCRSDCKHTHRPAPVKHHIHHRGTDTISVPTRPAKRPSHLFLTPESNINNSVRYSTERPLFRPLSRERNQSSKHSLTGFNQSNTHAIGSHTIRSPAGSSLLFSFTSLLSLLLLQRAECSVPETATQLFVRCQLYSIHTRTTCTINPQPTIKFDGVEAFRPNWKCCGTKT